MWVAFLAPHSGSPRDADDPSGIATPSPAAAPPQPLRERAAPDSAVVQRGRHLRQAGGDAQPAAADSGEDGGDSRELPAAARVAARGRRGGRADRERAHRGSGSSTTRTSSSPRTTGSSTASIAWPQRQGAALRAVDPRAAAHPRARDPSRRSTARSSSPTSTSRRRSSRRRALSPDGSWTAAR